MSENSDITIRKMGEALDNAHERRRAAEAELERVKAERYAPVGPAAEIAADQDGYISPVQKVIELQAELERVKAELREAREDWRIIRAQTEARLDKALAALRDIADRRLTAHDSDVARAAIAEIEGEPEHEVVDVSEAGIELDAYGAPPVKVIPVHDDVRDTTNQ